MLRSLVMCSGTALGVPSSCVDVGWWDGDELWEMVPGWARARGRL